MSAPMHYDAAAFADYWIDALAPADEAQLEEHLFACDACGTRLREVIALAEGVRTLARQGSLRMVISEGFLERAQREGLRVRQCAPPAGGSVDCTVTLDDDLLIGRLQAQLPKAAQIDLSLGDPQGHEQLRLRDIPYDPASSSVIFHYSITHAKALPSAVLIARLIEVEASGQESLLAEYTFNHTRTID